MMINRPVQDPDGWRLEARGLDVKRGGRTILDDVSVAIRAGECVSLVGPNGSGKTTLMRVLLGLWPPTRGDVLLDGRAWLDIAPRARGRFAAYVPQMLDAVPPLTVFAVVAGGRYPYQPSPGPLTDGDRQAVDAAIAQCGLQSLVDRRIDQISGGERQKSLIAAAIAQDPLLLCLDEPTTALDPAYQIELVGILQAWRSQGRALIVISHDLQLPTALGGRVIALREHRVAAEGDVDEVLTPEVLASVYGATFEMVETSTGARISLPAWWRGGHVAR